METMQPTLKNGRNVWDRINMPASEFQERVRRIRKEMKKEGIDVLLLYSNADEYGDPCYITNFIVGIARGALAIVPKKGEVALIYQGPSRGVPFSKTTTWVDDVRTSGDVSKECVKYLKEKELVPSTIGITGMRQFMQSHQFRFLSESLNRCKIVDCDPLLRKAEDGQIRTRVRPDSAIFSYPDRCVRLCLGSLSPECEGKCTGGHGQQRDTFGWVRRFQDADRQTDGARMGV